MFAHLEAAETKAGVTETADITGLSDLTWVQKPKSLCSPGQKKKNPTKWKSEGFKQTCLLMEMLFFITLFKTISLFQCL